MKDGNSNSSLKPFVVLCNLKVEDKGLVEEMAHKGIDTSTRGPAILGPRGRPGLLGMRARSRTRGRISFASELRPLQEWLQLGT